MNQHIRSLQLMHVSTSGYVWPAQRFFFVLIITTKKYITVYKMGLKINKYRPWQCSCYNFWHSLQKSLSPWLLLFNPFVQSTALQWESRVLLINSSSRRVRLTYWFFLLTSVQFWKLFCMITHPWHSTLASAASDGNVLRLPLTLNSEHHTVVLIKLFSLNNRGKSCSLHLNACTIKAIIFSASLLCLPLCRLKQKSQSVDIASQGFSPTLMPASPRNKAPPPVAKTTTGLAVKENNTANSQLRSPRCGELKRGYTIGKRRRADVFLI